MTGLKFPFCEDLGFLSIFFVFFFISVLESASDIMQDGILKLREDFRKPERTLSQKLTEAQQSFSEELEEVQQSFSDKLSEVEERASPLEEKVENNLDKVVFFFCFCFLFFN